MTCRRFEDEELFCWVLSLRGDQAVGVLWLQSGVGAKLGEKRPKGGSNDSEAIRVHPNPGGGLGLASMGFKCSGDWPGASSTLAKGIPWSGLNPLVVCGYPVDRNPTRK